MSFIDTFNLLRNNYEQKEKPENETSTYNLLRLLISQYGYDSVCDEISFNKGRNECKNKELSTIMTEIKKKVSIEESEGKGGNENENENNDDNENNENEENEDKEEKEEIQENEEKEEKDENEQEEKNDENDDNDDEENEKEIFG